MADENSNNPQEEPQLFSVKKSHDGGWQFSRRDFIKGAGATATVLGMGAMLSETVHSEEISINQFSRGARAHRTHITSFAITPDETLLISASHDSTIKLWSLPDGAFIKTITGHGNNAITSVVISPDGTFFASIAGDGSIKLWSLPDAVLIKTLEGHDEYSTSLAMSADGKLLVSGSYDNTVKLWSLPDGKLIQTLVGHTAEVFAVAISPDGSFIASGGDDELLHLWSSPPREIMSFVRIIQNVRVRSEPSTSAGNDTVIRTAGVGETFLLREGIETVSADNYTWVPITIDDQEGWVAQEGFIEFIEQSTIPELELMKTMNAGGNIRAIAISPDSAFVCCGGYGSTIRRWSLPDGESLPSFRVGSVNSIAISADSQYLVSGNEHRVVQLWDIATEASISSMTEHTERVTAVTINPEGTLIVSGGADRVIKLWSSPDGEYIKDLIDIAASLPEFEGAQYSPNDAGTSVITLPCGSPIPAGSTCICNCVAGSGCACVGDGSGGSTHYWYPN